MTCDCDDIRQRLLRSDHPDKPAAAEAAHLAGCDSCRAWLRRVAQLEEMLPHIPAPPSQPPAELLALFRAAADKPVVAPAAQRLPSFRAKREWARQKLALALALAATLSLFALTWWAVQHVGKPGPKPGLGVRRHNPAPRERLHQGIDEVRECLARAKAQPENAKEVAKQAARFRELLERDVVNVAKNITIGERQIDLPGIANLLARAQKEADGLARAWQTKHPESARSMHQMASAAEQAEKELRKLIAT
jgi:hypothetical protein